MIQDSRFKKRACAAFGAAHKSYVVNRKSIRAQRGARGFTLIELLVVMSIMLVITSAFLVSNTKFNSSILLRSLAYQVAISVRQAQVYGIGVREAGIGTGNFSAGYGVHFAIGTPTSYLLFADQNNNQQYDSGDLVVETFRIRNGYVLSSLCATRTDGVERCTGTIANLTVSFRRPNPEATIRTSLSGETYSAARITVSSPAGSTRDVSVGASGEISVQQTGN